MQNQHHGGEFEITGRFYINVTNFDFSFPTKYGIVWEARLYTSKNCILNIDNLPPCLKLLYFKIR